MQPPYSPQDAVMVQKLASALETALASIKESRQQIDESKNHIRRTSDELDKLKDETIMKLVSLHNEFPLIRENVSSLSKLIKEGGNGNDSLLTRLRLIESQDREINERLDRLIRELHSRIDAQNGKIESHLASHTETVAAQAEKSWQIKLAIWVAALSLVSAIFTPLLELKLIGPDAVPEKVKPPSEKGSSLPASNQPESK